MSRDAQDREQVRRIVANVVLGGGGLGDPCMRALVFFDGLT